MNKFFMPQTLSGPYRFLRQVNSTDASYTSRTPRLGFTAGADNQPSGSGDAAAQSTSLAVVDLSRTTTMPGTDGRADVATKPAFNVGRFIFWGTAAQDLTFKCRIVAWDYIVGRDTDWVKESGVWVPTTVIEVLCTTGSMQGIAGGVLNASQFLCDTIALQGTAGNDDVSVDIVSPADNTVAHLVVDFKGAQKFSAEFDRNSSAASCNGAWKPY